MFIEGKEEGRAEERREMAREIALKMLAKNKDDDEIAELSGLTFDEIDELRREQKPR